MAPCGRAWISRHEREYECDEPIRFQFRYKQTFYKFKHTVKCDTSYRHDHSVLLLVIGTLGFPVGFPQLFVMRPVASRDGRGRCPWRGRFGLPISSAGAGWRSAERVAFDGVRVRG